MTTLIYDGTFEGLLTAVFEIYQRQLVEVRLHTGQYKAAAMFENTLKVITSDICAARVLKGLHKKLSAVGLQRLYIAHAAEICGEENTLIGYIRYVFDSDINIEEDYGNRYVLRLSEMVRMARREKHRMEAFVRFKKLNDGVFYAQIEPDYNVLPLLIKHFKQRYADQKWIIYDLKRNYGVFYDLYDTQFITLEFNSNTTNSKNELATYTEDEALYQQLWKNYFHNVNIASRKNTRLHLRHMPRRYWKHLPEKF